MGLDEFNSGENLNYLEFSGFFFSFSFVTTGKLSLNSEEYFRYNETQTIYS